MGLISRFYDSDGLPSEIYNSRLYFSLFLFGVLGSARGYDEGNIASTSAQVSFINLFGLKNPDKSAAELANLKSNITSMVLLGSIGGSLIAVYFSDKFGRVKTLKLISTGWVIASIIQITSRSASQLYVGRFIEGLAIGQTVVVGPTYLAEVSPKNIRGLAGCLFSGSVYLGSLVANFANYGTALHISDTSNLQWIIPTSLKIVFAGFFFIGSCFVEESPRYLIKANKVDEAFKSLSRIRDLDEKHPLIVSEVSDITQNLTLVESEKVSKFQAFKDLFLINSIRYRLFLGLTAQLLAQWSFAGSITLYMPELTSLVGITGAKKIMFSGVLATVKLISGYISAFILIDYFGRRKCLYLGITIQLLSTLYYAVFLNVVPNITNEDYEVTNSEANAGIGALAALFLTGAGWAMGWNSIQYLINSEILPLRVRSLGTSIIMAFHYIFQYSNSKALPTMLIRLKPYGTFYFACAILVIGLFWSWFFLPEISGRSLESMEELFSLSWYLIGRKGSKLCPDNSEVSYSNKQMVEVIEDEMNDDNKHKVTEIV